MQLRFTDYDGRANDDLFVWGMRDGVGDYFAPNEVMPMWMTPEASDDEDGFCTVRSEKLGIITFQSIDIEEDN
jgi:hypothetical protein